MPRNKPRLLLALCARPKHPGTYHYALFVAPKSAPAPTTKHHVKNTLQVDSSGDMIQPWRYEQTVVPDVTTEQRLLVRIIIAKVATSRDQVQGILERMPVDPIDHLDEPGAQSFTCLTWVRDAFRELRRQGAVIATSDEWEDVERKALEYPDGKRVTGAGAVGWYVEGRFRSSADGFTWRKGVG